MFEARLTQGFILKKLADALKELVDEANFCAGSNGINMTAMDKSHVCLVALDLKRDMFDHYRCDRPMTMGINMSNLCKVLKCAGNEDIITLKAEDDGDALTLLFEATKKQDKVSEFELKLLSIDSEAMDIPDQDYLATVRMPAHTYQEVFKDMSSIGETVQMSAIKGQIKLTTAGDVGTAMVCLRENNSNEKDEDNVLVEVSQPVSLTFALRYLNNFSKASPLSPAVRLSLTKDLPVCVSFELGEATGLLRYFLAPKIDDEEAMDEDAENASRPL